MSRFHLDHLWEFLASIEPVIAMLWVGLAVFTAGLAVLLYTRWGQYKPLRMCMAMSLLAHLLLAGYAATVEIVISIPPRPEQVIHVTIGDGTGEPAAAEGHAPAIASGKEQPWEVFPNDAVNVPKEAALDRGAADQPAEPKRLARADDAKLPGDPRVDHVALADAKPLAAVVGATRQSMPGESPTAIEAPPAQHREAAPPAMPSKAATPERLAGDPSGQPPRAASGDVPAALLQQIVMLPKMTDSDAPEPLVAASDSTTGRSGSSRLKPVERVTDKPNGSPVKDPAYAGGYDVATASPIAGGAESGRLAAPSLAGLTKKPAASDEAGQTGAGLTGQVSLKIGLPPSVRPRGDDAQQPLPEAYRLRVAPDRAGVARSRGGTVETEAAVKAALKWLADNQAADGRWDPRTHDAGKESNVLGQNRQNAGSRADTAMTGLALLAFLASGHTHLDGPYREEVRRGLEYLMRSQAPDGNLAGQAVQFESMYCHAMAACALSEAFGMTHDARLREPVRRAVAYTIASQDAKGGGWRYRPGEPGDTSQLGWQLMSLKSAELAGIPLPEKTRQGIVRFLQSVSSGKFGGRASYRPGEQATRTMTAEALVCWQFLGLAREHPACNEAGDYLAGELPGDGTYNLYYWYYGTLGMYQLQGAYWQRWNDVLRANLVDRQVKEGSEAGSWDTNDLWGGHGGRVYTTAMAALALEVYYRFLPLYAGVSVDGDRAK